MASKKDIKKKKKNTPVKRDSTKKRKGPTNRPLTRQHQDYLNLVARTTNKTRRNKLIDAGSGSQIRAISECIHNIIFGNVPLQQREREALRKYKSVLFSLARRCQPVYKTKSILKQKGGMLSFLLPVALKAISSYVLGV